MKEIVFDVVFVGETQTSEEIINTLSKTELIELANESDDISTLEDAKEILIELGYCINEIEIPEIDSSGFDSNGINHFQDKLNNKK